MNPPERKSTSLESEVYRQAIARIIQVSRYEVRQILEKAGGVEAFSFPDGALQLHSCLPSDLRVELLKYLEPLRGAISHICPAEKLILESPDKRAMVFTVQPADESLVDTSKTVEQQQQFKELIKLEARCRVAMEQTKDLIVITDQRGWYLDCNFTKSKFGVDRLDAIGAVVDELFPHLADLAHDQLGEAFRYPEVGIYREFTHEPIPGLPQKFRARTIAYGDEALTQVTAINPYLWLS